MENETRNRQKKIDEFIRTFELCKKTIESGDNGERIEIACERTVIKIREKNANRFRNVNVKKTVISKKTGARARPDLDANLDHIPKDVNESLKETTAELEQLKLTFKHKTAKPKFGKGIPRIIAFAQQRAKERERLRTEIDERKRSIEEERTRQASLQDELKKSEKIAERQKALEKKRIEVATATEELLKKQRTMLLKQAAIHLENARVMKSCFSKWQVETRAAEQAKNDAALLHYKAKLVRTGMQNFLRLRYESMAKMNRAKQFHENKSIRSMFYLWKEDYKTTKRNAQVADDFHDACLLQKYFTVWRAIAYQYKMKAIASAVIYYESKLLRRYFDMWKTYPDRRRTALDKERRKEKWREAVREVVPDFDPHVEL